MSLGSQSSRFCQYELVDSNSEDNPADACTKKTPNTALEKLVSYNKLKIKVEAWVDRLTPKPKA
jgi:hypothetical protein